MAPAQEPVDEFFRDGVTLDETRQEPLAKQLHHAMAVPGFERTEAAVVREASAGQENMGMGMPLEEIA